MTVEDWRFIGRLLFDRQSSVSQSSTAMSESGKGLKSTRIVLIILGITFWSLLILFRLVQLQVFKHNSFTQMAAQGQQAKRAILAPRGIIYDRHMDELATSLTLSMAVAEPRRMKNIPWAAQNLAAILELDPRELLSRMKDPARQSYMVVKHRIDPQAEEHIKSMGIDGVYFVDENTRVYPNRDLGSQTLGFVNMNGDGGAGIELQYDRELKGRDGSFSLDIDAHGQPFRVNVDIPPAQGHSLMLSLDKSIQYIADRETSAGVDKARARSGTAIVMESDTGRILALSNYPQFNCNTYNEYSAELWRNKAVSDMYEPGSTFKVVVATAALEAGLARPDELIDCQMGSITVGGHVFHDHKGYGLLKFTEILENSSNIGAIKLGMRLGEQRLYEALRNFGFGSRTGIDLPGEIGGLVRDWKEWSGLSIGAISFGQEVGVTSMQILTAINAIANGGYRVRPSIVDRIVDAEGDLVSLRTPERVRLMSPQTAETVSRAFEGVVLRGTGKRAALEGYRAAGKTGTAQKSSGGRYVPGKYVSSFIGFAPLPAPKITVLVQIDEPNGIHYGGDVCAPIFQRIAQETLMQLRIPPDKNLPFPEIPPLIAKRESEDFLPDSAAVKPLNTSSGDSSLQENRQEAMSMPLDGEWIVLPDFQGLSKRAVLSRCSKLGIYLKASGSGVAVFQEPLPGAKIAPGATCSVTFARANVKKRLAAAEAHYAAQQADPRLSAVNRP